MILDTRKERITDSEILEEVDRTGKLPPDIKFSSLHERTETSSEGIAHTPWFGTGDERLTPVWKNTSGEGEDTPLRTEIFRKENGLIETKTDDGPMVTHRGVPAMEKMKYPPETRLITIESGGKEYVTRVPLVGGILFGLLGTDGTQENAPIKDKRVAFGCFAKYGRGFVTPVVRQSDVVLPKKAFDVLTPITGPEWWSEEARRLSENTISIRAAAIAMVARNTEQTRPFAHRFSGKLPDGTVVEDWTPEMLITRMKTYLFGPFPVQVDVMGEMKEYIYCVKIPAFSEQQARVIFEKRMMEERKVLYHGRLMYGQDGLSALGYAKGVLEAYDGCSETMKKMIPIKDIPITAVSKTGLTDFFQKGIRPCLAWSRDDSEAPFINGRWTSDDLGYAFSIIFADELGLKYTSKGPKPSPFTTFPYIIKSSGGHA